MACTSTCSRRSPLAYTYELWECIGMPHNSYCISNLVLGSDNRHPHRPMPLAHGPQLGHVTGGTHPPLGFTCGAALHRSLHGTFHVPRSPSVSPAAATRGSRYPLGFTCGGALRGTLQVPRCPSVSPAAAPCVGPRGSRDPLGFTCGGALRGTLQVPRSTWFHLRWRPASTCRALCAHGCLRALPTRPPLAPHPTHPLTHVASRIYTWARALQIRESGAVSPLGIPDAFQHASRQARPTGVASGSAGATSWPHHPGRGRPAPYPLAFGSKVHT